MKTRLIRLNGEQTARFWPALKKGFARSVPPGVAPTEILMTNMLQGILNRSHDCWLLQVEREDKLRQAAGMVTTVRLDPLTGHRTLFIYSLFARIPISDEEWGDAFDKLRAVAKQHKCIRVSAFSKNPSVIDLVNKLGGSTEMRVVELEV